MPGPSLQVVIDCADPAALAPFWAEILGYQPQPPPPGFDSCMERPDLGDAWVTMADPEGNEFCIQ